MNYTSIEDSQEYINLQIEMVRMQRDLQENKKRLVVIFEGRDTAGKGGAIMRFVRFINPRGYRIVALQKPTTEEKGNGISNVISSNYRTRGKLYFLIAVGTTGLWLNR